jgi:hypothetical protein
MSKKQFNTLKGSLTLLSVLASLALVATLESLI